jgi:hypothetical protein
MAKKKKKIEKNNVEINESPSIVEEVKKSNPNFLVKLWIIFAEYFREFWYIRAVNGKVHFVPSSKKFWAQIAQIGFFVMVYMKIFGSEEISDRLSDTLLIALAAHAAASVGWYQMGKSKDTDIAEKSIIVKEKEQAETMLEESDSNF